MFPLAFNAIFGVTLLGLNEEDYEGIVDGLAVFCKGNASKPDIVEFVDWVKNGDGTYSKLFAIVLANGAESALTTKWSIDEKEYFKRKLKHGQ